ncbi:geranylgeranylglycerol-phosphate geranylgeranyltransferase [Flavobacterium psychrophilum]|uniref:geranylgeranylglycerol-phosphate geranylgeranyltransferase n=1 Tax=Flavobacterium psychrophilum TaxID=96345 RepID=UPI000B7C2B2F|nr:geranylgeranylglycerol-phosphate geranylgeranyltransferase [Flavobacterium psychrophilum]MBF2024888.1 UbiA family prenyltransferase [Flavobacterium psychrophilum]MCB5983862.1 UbiA family prenyltransferase [Flavobacterium psychrophilum]MCB5994633.1 UbiA family prenyltransferase [Flavobacterium psychrophilum]MCB5996905.1 UbiA family prenyltransferase [Flavobacterium psychrophilum]MCB6004619.1 UbiA family prenyltransferase [Flavobacterium psychrophilum]
MKYLKLIRYQNLIMIALMQLIVLFGFLKMQDIPLALALWQYYLLIISTVCIAAGGYIINDIMDQDADTENKPKKVIIGKTITEALAYNLYVLFTVIGVGVGFYLSRLIMRPNFVTVFILCAALLYIYATNLKQIMILKNVIVASLLAFSIIIIDLFMIFPATDITNKEQMRPVFSVLIDFATIAFILNFIREIVKDLEDTKGDKKQEIRTLPVVFGVSKTSKLVFILSFVPVLCILYYVYNYLFHLQYATGYIFLFLIGPLLYFMIKIWFAQTKKDFYYLSNVLKMVILFGIISIAVIGINMKYYVA